MVSKVFKVYRMSSYINACGKDIIVPQIRLQGKWIERLGFTVDSQFQLYADNGVIILKSLKEA